MRVKPRDKEGKKTLFRFDMVVDVLLRVHRFIKDQSLLFEANLSLAYSPTTLLQQLWEGQLIPLEFGLRLTQLINS